MRERATVQRRNRPADVLSKPLVTHNYVDADGEIIAWKTRHRLTDGEAREQRRTFRWHGRSEDLMALPLFRLPELRNAIADGVKRVWVCEGESDVQSLVNAGEVLPAQRFGVLGSAVDGRAARSREVVVAADNDASGLAHGREVTGPTSSSALARATPASDAACLVIGPP